MFKFPTFVLLQLCLGQQGPNSQLAQMIKSLETQLTPSQPFIDYSRPSLPNKITFGGATSGQSQSVSAQQVAPANAFPGNIANAQAQQTPPTVNQPQMTTASNPYVLSQQTLIQNYLNNGQQAPTGFNSFAQGQGQAAFPAQSFQNPPQSQGAASLPLAPQPAPFAQNQQTQSNAAVNSFGFPANQQAQTTTAVNSFGFPAGSFQNQQSGSSSFSGQPTNPGQGPGSQPSISINLPAGQPQFPGQQVAVQGQLSSLPLVVTSGGAAAAASATPLFGALALQGRVVRSAAAQQPDQSVGSKMNSVQRQVLLDILNQNSKSVVRGTQLNPVGGVNNISSGIYQVPFFKTAQLPVQTATVAQVLQQPKAANSAPPGIDPSFLSTIMHMSNQQASAPAQQTAQTQAVPAAALPPAPAASLTIRDAAAPQPAQTPAISPSPFGPQSQPAQPMQNAQPVVNYQNSFSQSAPQTGQASNFQNMFGQPVAPPQASQAAGFQNSFGQFNQPAAQSSQNAFGQPPPQQTLFQQTAAAPRQSGSFFDISVPRQSASPTQQSPRAAIPQSAPTPPASGQQVLAQFPAAQGQQGGSPAWAAGHPLFPQLPVQQPVFAQTARANPPNAQQQIAQQGQPGQNDPFEGFDFSGFDGARTSQPALPAFQPTQFPGANSQGQIPLFDINSIPDFSPQANQQPTVDIFQLGQQARSNFPPNGGQVGQPAFQPGQQFQTGQGPAAGAPQQGGWGRGPWAGGFTQPPFN